MSAVSFSVTLAWSVFLSACKRAGWSGVELLVFGHVHRASWGDWPLPDGRRPRLVVLPAFDEAGEHLLFEAGELGVRGPDGAKRPAFAERRFT